MVRAIIGIYDGSDEKKRKREREREREREEEMKELRK